LALDLRGSGKGMRGGLHFLVAKGAWYVMGSATVPVPIVLGQNGVSMFVFRGGLGHNVAADEPGSTGVPGVDYQLVPDTTLNNWMFVAGLLIGSTPTGNVWWADLTLTVAFPQLMIDLNGKATFLSADGPGYHDDPG